MALDFSKLLAAEKAKISQPQSVVPSTSTPPPLPVEVKETAAVSTSPNAVIEYPGLQGLRDKIYALDKALLEKHPAMDSLLQTIHRNLQKDPGLIHLLKSEERAMIFAGLKQKTQTTIVQEAVKSASGGKNRGLKNIGLEDL